MEHFKVGDKVNYLQYEKPDEDDDIVWFIEIEYDEQQVFMIGNEDDFCDMVPAKLLRKIIDG